jgi:hypothetical protein
MSKEHGNRRGKGSGIFRYGYLVTLLFLTLSGFGQLPIFKRYYIADIPGFGWLAKFYTTHYIHYVAAIILITLLSYVIASHLLVDRRYQRVTPAGYIKGALLGGIVITGIFLVLRNLKGVTLSPGFIIFLDVSHLGFVMIFLMAALHGLLFRNKWIKTQ